MIDDKDLQKQIEDYLDGSMGEAEEKQFEQQVQNNPDWAAALQLNKEIHQSLRNPQALKMEQSLKDLGSEFAKKHQEKKNPGNKPASVRTLYQWMAAASILLLISILWMYLAAPKKLSNEQLFSAYYQAYPTSTVIRSGDPNTATRLEQAQENYQQEKYSAALQTLDSLSAQSLSPEDQATFYFFKGLSHLGLEQSTPAQKNLETVLQLSPNSYQQQTQWYLALLALQEGQREKTKKHLESIRRETTQGKYYLQAGELLKELR